MRAFFALLYHPFAFTYDLVAAIVSFGRWNDWVKTALPFIKGPRVLELGFGPGHLQRILLNRNLFTVGLDESRQMTYLAKRNLAKSGYPQAKLTRGLAQHLPFQNKAFNTIVATFPSEYIFDPQTLLEIKRCLLNGGRLVVLPAAWPKSTLLNWLYKVTGEIPPEKMELFKSKLTQAFVEAGFETEVRTVDASSSILLIIIAHT